MRTTPILVVLLIGSSVISAQERPGPGRGFPVGPPGPGVEILGVQPLEISAPVVGIPFSAETVTEFVQEFADGNRVEQRLVGSIARNGLGRIRREQPLGGVGSDLRIVTITVPDERVQYRLDDVAKTAWRLRMPPARPSRSDMPPRRLLPEGVATEPLAPSSWEGLKIEGTRTTLVIPAHSVGNQLDIAVINEQWYSPELRMVVQTQRSDPRMGRVAYKLAKLARREPPSAMFEIPSGYIVKDERPFGPPPPPESER